MAALNKDHLIELLRSIQIPDTERVKAVTQELQKTYYSHPVSLLLLIEVALTNQDEALRKLASVQALRLLIKYWLRIDPAQQQIARKHLLEGSIREPVATIRHSLARLLARMAHMDLENDKGDELLRSILVLCTDQAVISREVGSFIVFELMENDSSHFQADLPGLFSLLSRNIVDPESNEVRINTAKSIWSVLMLVETDDEPSVAAVQALVPPIVSVLKNCVTAGDEPSYTALFEVLSLFLSYDSIFLAKHFPDLLQFMDEMAINKELPHDVRASAIDLLSQCVRFRRMKIQSLKDVSATLVKHALAIMAEHGDSSLTASSSSDQSNTTVGNNNGGDDDDDDDDEYGDDDKSPPRAAMILVEHLASSLPPRQVIIPLLDEFAIYSADPNPCLRRAGILALGSAAEGAPEFLSTQIDSIMPLIMRLLCDPMPEVRNAALIGLTNIADEMANSLGKYHEAIITAVLQNLEAAIQTPTDRRSTRIIRAVCGALDSLSDGIDAQEMSLYGPKLIVPMGKLLSYDDASIQASAAGAIGSIALAMGEEFRPYYHQVLTVLAPFVVMKDTPEALALRSAACDAMGRVATAVGPEAFQPYVMDLMRASEDALSLEDEQLKETSFLLWGTLSRVYGEQFEPFLPGVFAGLLEGLKLEEQVLSMPSNTSLGEETSDGPAVMFVGGKKFTIKDSTDEMSDSDSEGDGDFEPITGTALEQEVAIETLGDVITNTCGFDALKQYVKPALESLMPLTEHSYEGCRKNAIVTFWRIYSRVWQVWEGQTGVKWSPGEPTVAQNPDLVELATILDKVTMSTWADESETSVVCDINSHVASTLKTCGPAVLAVKEEMLQQMMDIVLKLLTRTHACQQDLGDDKDEQETGQGSSELDWLVVDTALEVVTGLAAALGPKFIQMELWRVFERPILKLVSSSEGLERSTAVGVVAEIIKHGGAAITPLASPLYALLDRRMTDADMLTRSNSTYGMGQLIANVSDPEFEAAGIPASYPALWARLEPMLRYDAKDEAHVVDNTAGCLCRMMIRRPDPMFVAQVFPVVLRSLPLQGDYEENEAVFSCIYALYRRGDQTVQDLTMSLLEVFEKVLQPPANQLEEDSRTLVKQTVRSLYEAEPSLFAAHASLLQLAGIV